MQNMPCIINYIFFKIGQCMLKYEKDAKYDKCEKYAKYAKYAKYEK